MASLLLSEQKGETLIAELRGSTIIIETGPHVCIVKGTHATLLYVLNG